LKGKQFEQQSARPKGKKGIILFLKIIYPPTMQNPRAFIACHYPGAALEGERSLSPAVPTPATLFMINTFGRKTPLRLN
jgi:hypothetical protein